MKELLKKSRSELVYFFTVLKFSEILDRDKFCKNQCQIPKKTTHLLYKLELKIHINKEINEKKSVLGEGPTHMIIPRLLWQDNRLLALNI